jgi:hypothetical protein
MALLSNKFRAFRMAKRNYSKYQQDVISGYYKNIENIAFQKLGELLGELYLAESSAKKERLWQRVERSMQQLKVPPKIIAHIMAKRDIEVLAKNLQDWLKVRRKE